MRICIYDDLEEFRQRWREQLKGLEVLHEEGFDVVAMDEPSFAGALSVLQARQRSFREAGHWEGEEIPLLDEADIFVVDFDLFENQEEPFLKGETFAYLARCFSNCGLIVGLNRPDVNDFDLTLKGHVDSFADVNIRDGQLDNPGLWGETSSAGFRPWYWPVLPAYRRDFETKVEDVKKAIDGNVPMWEALGFHEETFVFLPRVVSQFLGGKPEEVRFDEFVMDSGNALHPKDKPKGTPASKDVVARIAAARISKWLERTILSEQNILVDAPHLVFRYPSLLANDPEVIDVWNRTARLTCEDLPLRTDVIESYRFEKGYWVSRPVWFWEGLEECDEISEVRQPWNAEAPEWVFCEDASQFCTEHQEFVANVESPFARRYVRRFPEPTYGPQVRFSM